MDKRKKKQFNPNDTAVGPTFRAYETFALARTAWREKETNNSIPSVDDVEEAKEFVEENEK